MKYVPPFGISDPDGSYINGYPPAGIEGSIPPAEAFEWPMRELDGIVEKAGIIPSGDDLLQVTKAVRSGYLNYAQDMGGPNTLVTQFDPPFIGLTPGLCLRVKVLFANDSTNVTIDVDANGPIPVIRANGATLQPADISAGQVVDMAYDGTNFQVINFRGYTSSTTNENTYLVDLPYVADTGISNNVIVAQFLPAITQLTEGLAVLVKAAHNNSGPVQIIVNGLPARAILNGAQLDIAAGGILPGMILFLVYDGAAFQLVNSAPATAGGVSVGGSILCVKRFRYQDTHVHSTSVQAPNYVEAYRVNYTPVSAGNKLLAQNMGIWGSGSGGSGAGKRNIAAFLQVSFDNGSTWFRAGGNSAGSGSGAAYVPSAVFPGFPLSDAWETAWALIAEVAYTYYIEGQLTVPAGAPDLIFRMVLACAAGNCPDVRLYAGTLMNITEYTG
jgi:hypothetical protein